LKSKNELKCRAQEYLQEKERRNLNINDEYSVTPKIPCPAIGKEGECTIYEARPVLCRSFGMPMYDYKNPEKIYACELNFREGKEIFDDKWIPNQTVIGMKWDELKEDFAQSNSGGKNFTTAAEAILGE
jgi:Fe-S-cluster containining protein